MTPFNLTDSFNTRGWRHLIARQHSQRESSVPSGEVSPLGDALCQGRRRASRGSPDPQGPNPPSTSPTLPPKTHREADARPQGGVLAETTERLDAGDLGKKEDNIGICTRHPRLTPRSS
ncbi:uncharacterized protein LOC144199320 isoform X2 [Stigmatopora nigra]